MIRDNVYAALNENNKAIEAYSTALSTVDGNHYSQVKLDALKE